MKRENVYQSGLIKRIRDRFPGVVILKNDASYIQGFPDLTLLYGPPYIPHTQWACLETKRAPMAIHQPNQDYYVEFLGVMGYSNFINPSNEEEVLDELQQIFGLSG